MEWFFGRLGSFFSRFRWNHLKTVWTAFNSDPDDVYASEEIMYCRLTELEKFFIKRKSCYGNYAVEYDVILKQIRLAMALNRIICRDGEGLYDVAELSDISKPLSERYKCLVKVNLKNAGRFVKEENIEFYKRFPHELYIVKARYLYHKILNMHMFDWFD